MNQSNLFKALGPGLLFAGAAIGVSHLIQSTRAGAEYALAMVGFILVANIMKYPAFLIGNRYSSAAGENLLSAYKRQGLLAIGGFVVATLLTMFVACASISLTTAALLQLNFNLDWSTNWLIVLVWVGVAAILFFGRYRALDILIKIILSFLTIATLAATILILPKINWTEPQSLFLVNYDTATILFIVALVGWMPAPLDTSVWQSLWAEARAADTNYVPSKNEATLDFNIGFLATTFLAVCFVFMGAGVMYNSGTEFEAGAVGFAKQIISLYEVALGATTAKIVGFAALAVIFSTTLTAIDAWPRTLAMVAVNAHGGEDSRETQDLSRHPYYWGSMLVLLAGAYIIVIAMMNSFTTLIDIATTVSFLMAPIFAFLNHRAMFGGIVPPAEQPGSVIKLWSNAGWILMSVFALIFLWFRFLS